MNMETEPGKERIGVIDLARFYAMALVFYGHFIERAMLLKNPAAAIQYKFIYSFHMLLFFILAGYVVRETDTELGFGTYLKHRFLSRLLPFLFFTVLFMIPPLFVSGDFYQLNLPTVQGYMDGLISTAFGIPLFCVPSWFLLLMFSVEMVHYGAFRFLRSSNRTILIAAVLFYVFGYWFNLNFDIVNPMKGRIIGWNYLFIQEAIPMYAFYLLGIYLRRKRFLMDDVSPKRMGAGALLSFLAVLFTFSFNTGPFNFNYFNSVVIIFSSHGNVFWFPLTAVMGSLFILFLAKLTPSRKIIAWMGQNTLILMCLNGIFYHYVNFRVAQWMLDTLPGSGPTIFGVGCAMTVISLAACIPLISFFDGCMPQLVGKPKRNGPWLGNLI